MDLELTGMLFRNAKRLCSRNKSRNLDSLSHEDAEDMRSSQMNVHLHHRHRMLRTRQRRYRSPACPSKSLSVSVHASGDDPSLVALERVPSRTRTGSIGCGDVASNAGFRCTSSWGVFKSHQAVRTVYSDGCSKRLTQTRHLKALWIDQALVHEEKHRLKKRIVEQSSTFLEERWCPLPLGTASDGAYEGILWRVRSSSMSNRTSIQCFLVHRVLPRSCWHRENMHVARGAAGVRLRSLEACCLLPRQGTGSLLYRYADVT
jgi:hypothetical protein